MKQPSGIYFKLNFSGQVYIHLLLPNFLILKSLLHALLSPVTVVLPGPQVCVATAGLSQRFPSRDGGFGFQFVTPTSHDDKALEGGGHSGY